jgi:hypothetical protein
VGVPLGSGRSVLPGKLLLERSQQCLALGDEPGAELVLTQVDRLDAARRRQCQFDPDVVAPPDHSVLQVGHLSGVGGDGTAAPADEDHAGVPGVVVSVQDMDGITPAGRVHGDERTCVPLIGIQVGLHCGPL